MNRKYVVIERSDNFETDAKDYPIHIRAVAVRSTEEKAMDAAFNASKAALVSLKAKGWSETRIGFAPDGGIMVTGFSKDRTWTLTYTISSTEDFDIIK